MVNQLKNVIAVNVDVEEELWTNSKVQAVKRRILLKDWVAEALQEKIDREKLNQ